MTVTWLVLAAFGFGLMWATKYTPPWADFILVRGAGVAFVGGGVLGVAGWLGALITGGIAWLFGLLNGVSSGLLGTAISGLLALVLCVLWVLGMVPGKLFSWDPPDWLIYGGLLLPVIAASVPGPLGDALRGMFHGIGTWAIDGLKGIVS